MTRVVALEKGFYHQIRLKGDVFDVPFTDEQIEKTSWLAPFGTKVPKGRVIPTNRSASMADVIRGIPAEDDEAPEVVDTLSQMTRKSIEHQQAHPRAYGLDPDEAPKPRRRGRPKGSKNKAKQAEAVSP